VRSRRARFRKRGVRVRAASANRGRAGLRLGSVAALAARRGLAARKTGGSPDGGRLSLEGARLRGASLCRDEALRGTASRRALARIPSGGGPHGPTDFPGSHSARSLGRGGSYPRD
jgi:hypothetical protein